MFVAAAVVAVAVAVAAVLLWLLLLVGLLLLSRWVLFWSLWIFLGLLGFVLVGPLDA